MSSLLGHNITGGSLKVQVRLFNSLTRFAGSGETHRDLELAPGATVGDLARLLGIPLPEIFLVLVNGRDVTSGQVGDPIKSHHMLEDRDIVAFSGPVPFSYGYGAPVV